ncbi:hypothetical protein [Rhodococcus qingshengii]|uniref:Uncharacterized protein n=1 Tax=Rhodococcus qingshengii TaxID=334542 RepID=A0A2A5JAH1_RHOSG|nr:hypothetical protein [Rhodococcus qingshengii]PCK26342.1 hypothetical protein CHR55_15310 [Rhodococcus qingshengii]
MILAQAEPVVPQVIIQSGTSWYIPVIATAIVAAAGWYFVHRASQSRDLLNWRRTTLLTAVSTLIEASIKRRALIAKGTDERDRPKDAIEEQEQRILTAEIQINTCMAEDVSNYARAIKKLHQQSDTALSKLDFAWGSNAYASVRILSEEETEKLEKAAYIPNNQLEWNHQQLVKALQIEIKLRKYEFNPDEAQVINIASNRSFRLPARMRKWFWTKKRVWSFRWASKKSENENKNAATSPNP